ncbi:MAG: tRNA (N6-threonylcarbamoyladenosine(37)-N6)-methyltransferase TrmO [Halobacteriota archaeon]
MYDLKPIGTVQSTVTRSRDMPLQGVPAVINVFDEFLEGLTGIESDTHINVIGWFDKADRAPLMVRPRKISPQLEKRGVFSLRSPVRPNPLSLTATRLVKVEGSLLHVEPLDLIDGSPVVDIKPYSAGWDPIFWARDVHSALITQYMTEEQVLAELFREAFNFHGEKCAAIAVAAKIAYDAARALETSMRDIHLQLPRNVNPHLADGLIGVSRATLGNARLAFSEETDIAIWTVQRSVSYRVFDVSDSDAQGILQMSSDQLFSKR